MHSIELTRAQTQQLVDHCVRYNLTQWFIAKDHGAYVGASCGSEPDQKCLFYFKGCDPEKDADWYDTAHAKFGGDDFGEHMQLADLTKTLALPRMTTVRIKVTSKSITLEVVEEASATPDRAAYYYDVRKPSGRLGFVQKDQVERFLLELCGGGMTVQQTAAAMQYGSELREKGRVTVKGHKIGPVGEV